MIILFLIFILCGFSILSQPRTVCADDIDNVNAIISSIPEDWPEAPAVTAPAAILMDAESGEILFAKNATKAMYPASTTKLMTALLTLENASLTDIVTFSQKAVLIPSGSSHIGMRRGEQMELRECLLGLLLPSANEVANALAEHVSGAIQAFVSLMNERAFQLGAVNTQFTNANGLHDDDHYTCCYDLALIMKTLSKNNIFTELSGTPSYVHHADELLNKDIPMMNTNMMVRPANEYYNENVICGKTGHTAESGYNLVTFAEKEGVQLIVVVMGCEEGQQYVSTQSLLDYGFNYFHPVLPAELDSALNMENAFTSSPLRIPVKTASLLSIDATDTILLPDNVNFSMLTKSVEDIEGGKLITYIYQDYPLGTVTLKSSASVVQDPVFKYKEPEDYTPEETLPLITLDGWLLAALGGMLLFFLLFTWILVLRKRPKNPYKKMKMGQLS